MFCGAVLKPARAWQSHLKASMSLSTFWASPWTRTWAWNFLRASSSSMPEKSISSTTQLWREQKRQRWKREKEQRVDLALCHCKGERGLCTYTTNYERPALVANFFLRFVAKALTWKPRTEPTCLHPHQGLMTVGGDKRKGKKGMNRQNNEMQRARWQERLIWKLQPIKDVHTKHCARVCLCTSVLVYEREPVFSSAVTYFYILCNNLSKKPLSAGSISG